jgi:hypothetical protein
MICETYDDDDKLMQRRFADLSVSSSSIIFKTELNTQTDSEAVISVCCRALKVFWISTREFFDLVMVCGVFVNSLTMLYAILQLCYASVTMAIILAVTLRGIIMIRGL